MKRRFFSRKGFFLESGVFWVSREGDNVSDVFHAGDVLDEPFESKAKARMGRAAKFAEIEIPAVDGRIEVVVSKSFLKQLQALLSLRASDELSCDRNEEVHRGNCFSIIVCAHVEGLDGFRVVVENDWTFEVFFSEIALMLGLEVDAPLDWISERAA